MLTKEKHLSKEDAQAPAYSSRRNFLAKITGAATIGVVAVSCQKEVNSSTAQSALSSAAIDPGTGDIAILNYAYLLEQLEAHFYTVLTSSFYKGATDYEKKRFSQVRDHEIAHREFFKTALGSSAIPEIAFNFSSIDFSDKMSVLTTARTFEDLGVSAYNGAGKYIVSGDYLLAAGKIVSVEARHAAFVRDVIDPLSFADSTVVDANGLDVANPPSVVIAAVKPYIATTLQKSWFPNM